MPSSHQHIVDTHLYKKASNSSEAPAISLKFVTLSQPHHLKPVDFLRLKQCSLLSDEAPFKDNSVFDQLQCLIGVVWSKGYEIHSVHIWHRLPHETQPQAGIYIIQCPCCFFLNLPPIICHMYSLTPGNCSVSLSLDNLQLLYCMYVWVLSDLLYPLKSCSLDII